MTKASKSTLPPRSLVGRKARIFLVDDHPMIRHGLVKLINEAESLEICGEAGSAAEALEKLKTVQPDLAIVDISLGDRDGIDLIKDIHSRYGQVKVLISSMHSETFYAERVLRAGAKGYISKGAEGGQFLEAIRQVLRGGIYVSPAVSERMLQRMTGTGEVSTTSLIETLSDRELEIFGLIGQGLGTRQIAEKLFLSVKTIETHREHIKAKLHLKNGNELVLHAMQWQFKNA